MENLFSFWLGNQLRKKSPFGDHESKLKKKLQLNLIYIPGQITGKIWRVHVTQKRFYTRGTLRGIRISRLAKIPTLVRDWLR